MPCLSPWSLHISSTFRWLSWPSPHWPANRDSISLINSASSNLQTSSVIALSHSWENTLFFWWMRGKEGDMFNLWTIMEGSIPSMSSWLQVKTSWFFLRNVMSAWRIGGLARVPILVFRSGLELSRSISSNPSTGSATVCCSSMLIVCEWSFISNIAI